MARAFRHERGRVTAKLEPYETALLRGLVEDVVRLVRTDDARNAATARLFPAASEDAEVAASLHDLIHDDLREAKLDNARALLASLPADGRVSLDEEAADQWLSALNDVRLALGTAIGITPETYDAEPGEDDAALHLYDWLTAMQDSLVEAVSARGIHR
jgi:hypothetical protein